MQTRFKTILHSAGKQDSFGSLTLDGALAVVRQFELEHAGSKEAWASVYELDGSNAGFGTKRYSFWGGARIGPLDARNPIISLFRKAIDAGERVVIGDETGLWTINHGEPVGARKAA